MQETAEAEAIRALSRVFQTIQRFEATDRHRWPDTVWYADCTDGQAARVFFSGTRNSTFSRSVACKAVADVFATLSNSDTPTVIKPKLVEHIRATAQSLREAMPAIQYLPYEAQRDSFHVGLKAVSNWEPPISAPTNSGGNPLRRAITLSLARRFADDFSTIPVEYIHHLITLCWPSTSLSATRRVLSFAVTTAIKFESSQAKKQLEIENSSAVHATSIALRAASRPTHKLSDSDADLILQLQDQIDRLNAGRSQFFSDTARVRFMMVIAKSYSESPLSNEITAFLKAIASDYGLDE